MRLARGVRRILDDRGVRYVLVGAHAASVYGVVRATKDVDYLTVDRAALDAAMWLELGSEGVDVSVRAGDALDPLGGIVRFTRDGERGGPRRRQVEVRSGDHRARRAPRVRAELPRGILDSS